MEVIIWIIFITISFVFYVKILNKAGYSGWYSVLMIIPFIGFIKTWFFAFLKWPVIIETESRKKAGEDIFFEK